MCKPPPLHPHHTRPHPTPLHAGSRVRSVRGRAAVRDVATRTRRHRPSGGPLRKPTRVRQRRMGGVPLLPAGLTSLSPTAPRRDPSACATCSAKSCSSSSTRPTPPYPCSHSTSSSISMFTLHTCRVRSTRRSRWRRTPTPTRAGRSRTIASSGRSPCTAGHERPSSASVTYTRTPRCASQQFSAHTTATRRCQSYKELLQPDLARSGHGTLPTCAQTLRTIRSSHARRNRPAAHFKPAKPRAGRAAKHALVAALPGQERRADARDAHVRQSIHVPLPLPLRP